MRIPKEYVEIAKAGRLAMFALKIDRKYTIPSNRGGGSEHVGVALPEKLPALQFAHRIMLGVPYVDALAMLQKEMEAFA